MTRTTRLYVAAGAALLAGGLMWKGGAAPQGSGPPTPATPSSVVNLLVMLGLKASAPERWDGTARVSGGELLATQGRHFSQGDEVASNGTWRASTLEDRVPPYADLHYTEMRPGIAPEVLHRAVGVYLTIKPGEATRVNIETSQGNFDFALSDIGSDPKPFLDGRTSVVQVPAADKLTTANFEDDEPAMAAMPGGKIAVAWVAYRDRADRVLLRIRAGDSWSSAEEVTPKPADVFRCSVVTDAGGDLWVFWSQREVDRWQIWGRHRKGGSWQSAVRLASDGSNTFHRAAASPNGAVMIAYQSYRAGQSDIYLKVLSGEKWSDEIRLSESPANDWEPAIAAGPNGEAHVAWDSYAKGNYDIFTRSWIGGPTNGKLTEIRQVTASPKFQAHASVAVDAQGRPWLAWDESGVNWGKDQGFLIPTPLAAPLHQERAVRIAMWDGSRPIEPRDAPPAAFPAAMRQNAEHPQILFDGSNALHMVFRHWTRRNSRSIGSPMVWENYHTTFDGARWSEPRPLPSSGSWIEKVAALARDDSGVVWSAWMTDGRLFQNMVPQNSEIYSARLGKLASATYRMPAFQLLADPLLEEIPVHNNETADVKAIRDYSIAAGTRRYKIYRGDMHRHTDVSQDFKYDGSLLEVYRYGLDAAAFDYIVPTDHQTGYDQEFTWWQNQKLVDLFQVAESFRPLYGSERSLNFPNGHRNIVFAQRGVRTLPIPPEEASGKVGAAKLFAYLKQNRGISMPHSSATNQGTDWRDNDPEVEPLIEIFQGYRNSYEYEGAPRAATSLNLHAQKSGWQPSGFWWNALAKGYKLGVQASSDHWSTHISYACLVAENFTREGLLDAIRRRHAYAATDNIILDFQARSGADTYIMGDSFSSQNAPQLRFKAIGTGAIKQVDLIKNRKFVYTARPGTKEVSFEFTDQDFAPGESWYYVRVLQEDGQLAWSSPIWVKKNGP